MPTAARRARKPEPSRPPRGVSITIRPSERGTAPMMLQMRCAASPGLPAPPRTKFGFGVHRHCLRRKGTPEGRFSSPDERRSRPSHQPKECAEYAESILTILSGACRSGLLPQGGEPGRKALAATSAQIYYVSDTTLGDHPRPCADSAETPSVDPRYGGATPNDLARVLLRKPAKNDPVTAERKPQR